MSWPPQLESFQHWTQLWRLVKQLSYFKLKVCLQIVWRIFFSLQFSCPWQMLKADHEPLCQCCSDNCQGRKMLWNRDQLQLINDFLQNPVAHCWTDEKTIKGKFCNVCRKKMHEVPGIRCEGRFHRYCCYFCLSICLFSCGYATKNVYFHETLRWFM